MPMQTQLSHTREKVENHYCMGLQRYNVCIGSTCRVHVVYMDQFIIQFGDGDSDSQDENEFVHACIRVLMLMVAVTANDHIYVAVTYMYALLAHCALSIKVTFSLFNYQQ